MKILVKCNQLTKCYQGEINSELTAFIKEQFGLEPQEYEIFEHPPQQSKGGKVFSSIAEYSTEPVSKLIELKIKPGETSDGIPLCLKKILCQPVKGLSDYNKHKAEKLFKLASLRPELLKYPYFNFFNSVNSQIKFKGGMPFVTLCQNYRDSEIVIVRQHVFKLLHLKKQEDQLPYNNFLLDYLIVPDDLEICHDYILGNYQWEFAQQSPLLDQLLMEAEQKEKEKNK